MIQDWAVIGSIENYEILKPKSHHLTKISKIEVDYINLQLTKLDLNGKTEQIEQETQTKLNPKSI